MPDIICNNCGSINDFRTEMKSNQQTAWCNGCDRFIKNIPQGKPPVLFFGKFKGRLLQSMTALDELKYLEWVSDQPWCASLLKRQIAGHFDTMPIIMEKLHRPIVEIPTEPQTTSQEEPNYGE